MKIFIDTANLEQIEEVDSWGILDGVTTNPTLVAKEKGDFKTLVRKICEVVGGPVSVEAMSTTAEEIWKEGKELAKIHPNVVIKVPMTEEGLKATRRLAKDDVPLIPLHQQPLCWAVRNGVNVILGADELPRLWYATVQ